MTEEQRQLIFKVVGNDERNFALIFRLKIMKDFDWILRYCVKQNITGKTFYELNAEHGFSPVQVGSYLLKKIEQEFRQFSIKDLS